jgi:hypothetical protein
LPLLNGLPLVTDACSASRAAVGRSGALAVPPRPPVESAPAAQPSAAAAGSARPWSRPAIRPALKQSPGQLVKHERAGRVGADRRDKRDAQPEPRRGDRGNRGGPADHQVDAAHQLLLLAEGGRHVAAEYQHIRIAVAEHQQVHRPGIRR